MLMFLFWGIALNVYSCVVLFIIIKAIYPKGYKSPYEKPMQLMLKIGVVLVPYMVFLLFILVMVAFVVCKFDYKEIEEFKKIVYEKERSKNERD